MSAKANVLIEDNAHVYSGGGNSGIGWAAGSEQSLLNMTGGTLVVNAWNNFGSFMNVGGNALFKTNSGITMDRPKAQLTSHSRMSGSRSVITPS